MPGAVHEEGVTILNSFAPGNKASQYVEEELLEHQGKIDKSVIMIGNFTASLSN